MLVFVLFLAVLFATIATLRYTKSAVLSSEKRQLIQITQNLAREYEDRAEVLRQNNEPPPLSVPTTASSREVLGLLTRVVLQNVDGVNGGFYSKAEDTLLGYPEPNQGGFSENPAQENAAKDEEKAVFSASRSAVANRQSFERVLTSGSWIAVIEAVPIRDGYTIVGGAWSVKRLASLPGSNRFRAYLASVGLGTAALVSVLLTLLMIRNLQGGVQKIEGGLESLEQNLESRIDTENDPEEIQRIVQAINRLGETLKAKIAREKQIESDLRHAERLASLGRLVAGVAHEVRNPLATIRLRVQMCRRETNNPRVNDSCNIALEEIGRLNGMVNRLLNFSRPVQLRPERTDLRRLVEERMESFREQAVNNHVQLVVSLPVKEKILVIDKSHMAQVFDNIIQNAIEAMAEGGGTLSVNVASIETDKNASQVRVEFRDTGKGMNATAVSRVFDPFFTTKPFGTGLGLSICHELVTAHGGDIQVESEEGSGTSIRITIPARRAAAVG